MNSIQPTGVNQPQAFAGVDPNTGQMVAYVNPVYASPQSPAKPVKSNRAVLLVIGALWGALALLGIHAITGSNADALRAENAALKAQVESIRRCINGR